MGSPGEKDPSCTIADKGGECNVVVVEAYQCVISKIRPGFIDVGAKQVL